MIGFVHATDAGRRAAEQLADAWPLSRSYPGDTGEQLRAAWAECEAIVCFLATGAAIRLAAPLMTGKREDPALVCVDEARQFAVALLGGHATARNGGGANALATEVAAVFGAQAVITTASEAAGVTALDAFGADLGFRIEDPAPLAAVGRALLDGAAVRYASDAPWPVPALPPNVTPTAGPGGTPIGTPGRHPEDVPARLPADRAPHAAAARHSIVVTDRAVEPDPCAVVYRPRSLVVGVGASKNAPAREIGALIDAALADAGLSQLSVRHVATIDVKAHEPGILAAAAERGWEVVSYPATALSTVDVPNPSEVVRAEVGTGSVAEAAALFGGRSELVVEKRKSAMATVAVARHRPRGRLALVGIGPGAADLLTPRAAAELRRASVVVGLDQYVDQIRGLLRPGTRVLATPLGKEEERARSAVDEAAAGHAVALIGSGDAGVYAMASPAVEMAGDADIDIVGVPGVTAAIAAAHALGAPLGHDHAYVSLSDLHTPWPAIERRLRAAAEGDFVVCLYNPRSRGRDWQLPTALEILAAHRPADTPVGLVRNATRDGESVEVTTIAALRAADAKQVDMMTVVLVGCSQTQVVGGRMVTPRGYTWMGASE